MRIEVFLKPLVRELQRVCPEVTATYNEDDAVIGVPDWLGGNLIVTREGNALRWFFSQRTYAKKYDLNSVQDMREIYDMCHTQGAEKTARRIHKPKNFLAGMVAALDTLSRSGLDWRNYR